MSALRICLVSSASGCAYSGHAEVRSEPVSSDEFAALKAVSVSPLSRAILGEIESRLMQLGYFEEVLGNLVITDDDVKRIALGE
jgi:hypothetical protein